MNSPWRPAILLALLVAIGSGCGAGGPGGKGGDKAGAEPPAAGGVRQRAVDQLPAVGDYLPPLDDGQVEVAGPQGWNLLPRDRKYLVRFVKGQPSSLPRLLLYVEDSPSTELTDVTADNAGAWGAWFDKQLASQSQVDVTEPNLPIKLGQAVFLRHVRLASLSGTPVVIQSLATVQGGRLYKIELVCAVDSPNRRDYEVSLKKHRDDGYAVAAHMKFAALSDAKENPSPSATGEPNPMPEANPEPEPDGEYGGESPAAP